MVDSMLTTANGTTLFTESVGQGRPMVVLHGGLGFDHTYFRPFLDPLGDELRMVLLDHRGHGKSGRPPIETLTHDQLAADVEAVRADLGLGKIVLFGHSYGGFIALEYAIRYPDRLAGLVLACTAPAIDYSDEIMANAKQKGDAKQLAAADRLFANEVRTDEDLRATWADVFPLYFVNYDPALAAELDRKGSYSGAAAHRAFGDLVPSYNVVPRLGEIRVPTLILSGRHDWITPVAQGERLQRGIEGSELVVFERSGHYPFIEEQPKFLAAMRSWLARLPRPVTSTAG
jgi:proline iminopeptidase